MKRHLERLGTVLLLLLLCTACGSTRLALVDDTFGFEHLVGDHGVHLAHARAVIVPAPDKAQAGGAAHRLVLDLRVRNDGGDPWAVDAANFTLTLDRCAACTDGMDADGTCKHGPCTASVEREIDKGTLVTVPPHSTVPVQLPILIRGSEDDLHHGHGLALTFEYREHRFEAKDVLYLRRRLLLSRFDQGVQTLRFSVVLTSALLAAFLL